MRAAGSKPPSWLLRARWRASVARERRRHPTAQANLEQELEQRAAAGTGMAAQGAGYAIEATRRRRRPPARSEAIKLYDQLLAKYPALCLSATRCCTRRRAHRASLAAAPKSMKVMEQLIEREPWLALSSMRCSSGAPRISSSGSKFTGMRRTPTGAIAAHQATGFRVTPSWRSTSSAGRSTSRTCTRKPCTSYFTLSTTKVSARLRLRCQACTPAEERRVEDTFQVTSLSLSNLGGAGSHRRVLRDEFGHRVYEDRVYRYLGEFYLDEAPLSRTRPRSIKAVRRPLSRARCGPALQHAAASSIYERWRLPGSWCWSRRSPLRAS